MSLWTFIDEAVKGLGEFKPGDWESGEGSARLGEAVLHELLPASRGKSMSAPEGYGVYAPGFETPDIMSYERGGGTEGGYAQLPGGAPPGYRWSSRKGHYVRIRRMNPLNGHAAKRAIRRIIAARHMLHQIESHLPKAHSRGGGHRRFSFHRKRRR